MSIRLRPLVPLVLACATAFPLDQVVPVVPPAPAPGAAAVVRMPAISDWTSSGRLGAYVANVATTNADTSRDTTIATTAESTSYLFTYEGQANWKSDKDSIDNLLKARYGRIRTNNQAWQENNDEIRYDGVYRRELVRPHFVYLGWGGESVFTGPDPRNYAFDPTTGKASTGYGQRYEDFLPDKNHCEGRIGVRAQKSWGPSVPPEDDDVETGIEAFLRYEHLLKRGDGDYDVRFFAQYEGFAEFEDFSHITNLVTAGLTMQLTRYLAVELGLRAYYETTPERDEGTGIGYDEWSIRQDSLFGLTYFY
ncbi:MAG: DUF3078 domain-containing protein [Planctomycetes bacterium]|nr:DUF3078 domain-containing protein [Planctomycetota bacterium]